MTALVVPSVLDRARYLFRGRSVCGRDAENTYHRSCEVASVSWCVVRGVARGKQSWDFSPLQDVPILTHLTDFLHLPSMAILFSPPYHTAYPQTSRASIVNRLVPLYHSITIRCVSASVSPSLHLLLPPTPLSLICLASSLTSLNGPYNPLVSRSPRLTLLTPVTPARSFSPNRGQRCPRLS